MLYFTSIASGSNGNCYYIGTEKNAVLIDAGIAAGTIIRRMKNCGLDPGIIRGIFVTHEHTDHVRGVSLLAEKYAIPLYLTENSLAHIGPLSEAVITTVIQQDDVRDLGNLEVRTFAKRHDALEPFSVTVSAGGKSVSVLTDIGFPCENVIESVTRSDVLFLESNYDEKMLAEGSYPPFLKKRIAGSEGHLSNLDSSRLVYKYAHPRLKYLFLSHLSEKNNTPAAALSMMEKALAERPDLAVELIVTDRYGEVPLRSL